MGEYVLHHGDCLEVLRTLADRSVDAVVTDPPYGLAFMGKRWDYDVPAVDVWAECLRVLKPGGHLLAFAGTRTQHRMAVRIEDAGFEIRDMIAWVYGSGFPKSLDVSKAIDKRGGATANFEEFRDAVKKAMKEQGLKTSALADALGNFMLSHYLTAGSQPAIPNYRDFKIIREFVNLGDSFNHLFAAEAEREVVGQQGGNLLAVAPGQDNDRSATTLDITAPATDAARQWHGWGTALKPALEPITVARKPLSGTVAATVLEHGTGALNVDGCRVGVERTKRTCNGVGQSSSFDMAASGEHRVNGSDAGRWPANLIHDGSEEVTELLSDSARFFYCAKASKRDRDEGCEGMEAIHRANGNKWTDQDYRVASGKRPPSAESGPRRNHHPTVKPTDLMRYLCRLVTPPNGTILDPFTGSGSTGKAAMLEGFQFIGIEREAEYVEIAKARIEAAKK